VADTATVTPFQGDAFVTDSQDTIGIYSGSDGWVQMFGTNRLKHYVSIDGGTFSPTAAQVAQGIDLVVDTAVAPIISIPATSDAAVPIGSYIRVFNLSEIQLAAFVSLSNFSFTVFPLYGGGDNVSSVTYITKNKPDSEAGGGYNWGFDWKKYYDIFNYDGALLDDRNASLNGYTLNWVDVDENDKVMSLSDTLIQFGLVDSINTIELYLDTLKIDSLVDGDASKILMWNPDTKGVTVKDTIGLSTILVDFANAGLNYDTRKINFHDGFQALSITPLDLTQQHIGLDVQTDATLAGEGVSTSLLGVDTLTVVASQNYVNNAVSAIGSGTNNYVPRWTPDGNTLGNSIIQDNGSQVGVGVAPSTVKFRLLGDAIFDGGTDSNPIDFETTYLGTGSWDFINDRSEAGTQTQLRIGHGSGTGSRMALGYYWNGAAFDAGNYAYIGTNIIGIKIAENDAAVTLTNELFLSNPDNSGGTGDSLLVWDAATDEVLLSAPSAIPIVEAQITDLSHTTDTHIGNQDKALTGNRNLDLSTYSLNINDALSNVTIDASPTGVNTGTLTLYGGGGNGIIATRFVPKETPTFSYGIMSRRKLPQWTQRALAVVVRTISAITRQRRISIWPISTLTSERVTYHRMGRRRGLA